MSEQDLVNSVVDYITRIGGVATRVNSGMFTIEGDDGKRRMVRGAPAGTSDVIACIRGKYWAIECKVGRNEPTVLQRDFLDRVADAGGMAIVVYDIDTLIQVVGAVGVQP